MWVCGCVCVCVCVGVSGWMCVCACVKGGWGLFVVLLVDGVVQGLLLSVSILKQTVQI